MLMPARWRSSFNNQSFPLENLVKMAELHSPLMCIYTLQFHSLSASSCEIWLFYIMTVQSYQEI